MNEKVFFRTRLYFIGIITIFIWSLLIWDHFHGGVPIHHLLHREDLPGFSNWLGGLLLPLLTWFLLYRVQKRTIDYSDKSSNASIFPLKVIYGFFGALFFGIVLSVFFTFGNTEVPFYMIIGLFLIALFLPIYLAECFLGFVIGMTFTFGGVLPIIIISIITLIGAFIYLFVRPALLFVKTSLEKMIFSNKKTEK